jgi:ribosomal protein S18 acetylase RimI-like enzyme
VIGQKPVAMIKGFKPLIEEGKVYIALIDNEIMGVLAMWLAYESLYIDTLAVNPKAQKQGIGQRLMQFAETEAAKLNQSKLSLCTNTKMQANRDYYARYGYHETHYDKLEDGRDIVWMEKPVTPIASEEDKSDI